MPLLGLYYFRWAGTPKEFKEYVGKVKSISGGIKGVDFKGVFMPTSEWNAALLLEATNFNKALEVFKTYMKKHGPHPKIPLAKLELLFTFQELGYPKQSYK